MAEKKADLIFKYYRIGESKISLDINAKAIEGEIEISINNQTRKLDGDSYEIELLTSVVNDAKTMDIQVKMTAYFDVSSTLDDDRKMSLIKINAPAIMFPYIRAYISTLTGLSGLAPVIIPAVNLAASNHN